MLAAILKEKAMEPEKKDQTDDKGRPGASEPTVPSAPKPPRETGGPKGPEPTRYNDWERGGRCIDF